METFKLASRYYYAQLPESTQFLYRALYDEWARGGSEVALPIPGDSFKTEDGISVSDLISYVLDDNPQIFHLDTSLYHYSRYGDTVTVRLDPLYTREEYEAIYEKLHLVVNKILEAPECRGGNEERMWYLHSYLAATVEYDSHYKESGDKRRMREVHSIVGPLLRRRCVCDGYSRAFRLLCDLACVSCAVMNGMAGSGQDDMGPHAWNLVRSRGKTYQVDVTWDRKPETNPPVVLDDFFLRSDSLFSRSHSWTRRKYPECPEDSPFRPARQKSRAEIEDRILKELAKGKKKILLHLDESFPGSEYLGTIAREMFERYPGKIPRGSYTYLFVENSLRGEIEYGL